MKHENSRSKTADRPIGETDLQLRSTGEGYGTDKVVGHGSNSAKIAKVFSFRLRVPSDDADDGTPARDSHGHYTGDAGRRYHSAQHGIPEKAYPWIARLRARKLDSYVRPDNTVLEYGVGAGWNLASLKCARRIGYDVAHFLEQGVRSHGIEFVTDTASLKDESIDVVICHHVLEHILEPRDALDEIRRLLRPGGTLWLCVPYDVQAAGRSFRPDDPHHHLYSWSVQTLANLAQEVGFRVEQASLGRFGYDRFAAITSFRLHLGEPGYKLIRAALHALRPVREVRLIAKAEKETEDHVTG